jgi:murein L,D-transpeptidase YcbB/YkuD
VWDAIPPSGNRYSAWIVIIGRALRTQTRHLLVEQPREVIFRPYWNVPPRSPVSEILLLSSNVIQSACAARTWRSRAVLETRRRLAASGRTSRGSGREAVCASVQVEECAGTGQVRAPNEENVLQHGTPAQELFGRNRRDFSHGCVRVEDPVALAEWVLQDRPEWTRSRILAAMDGTQSVHVLLPRPIRVILFYTTAAVMPDDGTIRFAEDIYRYDAALDRALGRRSPGCVDRLRSDSDVSGIVRR